MGRNKLRSKDDHRIDIHLTATTVVRLRKLMKKQGTDELKPYIEDIIMKYVMEQEDEGVI